MRTRAGAGVAVAAAMLVVVVAAPTGATTAAAPTPGPAGVTLRTETFIDASRSTPAVPTPRRAGRSTRTLVTRLWLPAGRGPFPLIVFSHGCGGSGRDYASLLQTWAAAGYVVAAPDFPISSLHTPGVTCVIDVVNQPGDVSFVISRVLALDRARGGLGHVIDPTRIGVAGHSLGAVTTLGVAYRPCCLDRRITAAISFSGTALIRGTDFRGIRTPLLLVHGDADQTVSYGGSVAAFARAAGPRYLLTILGGMHSGYLGGTDPVSDAVSRASLDFWAGYLRADSAALARLSSDAVVPGATTLRSAG